MELDPGARDHAEVGQGGIEVVHGRTDEPVLLEQTSRLQGRHVVRGSNGVRARPQVLPRQVEAVSPCCGQHLRDAGQFVRRHALHDAGVRHLGHVGQPDQAVAGPATLPSGLLSRRRNAFGLSSTTGSSYRSSIRARCRAFQAAYQRSA